MATDASGRTVAVLKLKENCGIVEACQFTWQRLWDHVILKTGNTHGCNSFKLTAFWDIAPCGLVEVDHSRGVYCLYHQNDNRPYCGKHGGI
jgi:hypothetical protein